MSISKKPARILSFNFFGDWILTPGNTGQLDKALNAAHYFRNMKTFGGRVFILSIMLIGCAVTAGLGEDEPLSSQPRLANGMPIDGMIQETNTEGLVIQTQKGILTYPWKYLSVGTRYRYERPFLVKLAAEKTNTVKKATSPAGGSKPASTNTVVPAAGTAASTNVTTPAEGSKPASTNVAAQAGAKDITTNAPSKTPDAPAKKKKSRTTR